MKGFSLKHIAWKVDVTAAENVLFVGVHPCTFQPGNFTGWGSEGVKGKITGGWGGVGGAGIVQFSS